MLALPGTSRVHDKECNPPMPKVPIMMGGALPLAFVEETRISPYEFVQQRRSLEDFLEMKVRNVLAGRRSLRLWLFK